MGVPLNIDWQQILLHLLNFVILFGALYFLLYKPVKDFMAKRENHYKALDDETNLKLAEAEKMRAEYEQKLRAAEEEAQVIRTTADSEALKEKEEILKSARSEGEQILQNARNRAVEEHKKMLVNARGELTDLLTKATEKIVKGGEDVKASFDSFLDQVERDGADNDH